MAAIYRQFADTAIVTENDRILGKSGELRQIDVALRTSVVGSELLVIVECKDYRRPVSKGKVDELIGKMEDVCAARAILVSDSGFTKGAVQRATADGRIQLVSVIDTENGKLRSVLYMPIHVEFHDLAYPFNVQFWMEPLSGQLPDTSAAGSPVVQPLDFHRAIHDHITAVIQTFFEWCQHQTPEMAAGMHMYRQIVTQTPDQALMVEITFEKRVRAYFNRDIYARGRGIFDHASGRLLATSGLHHVVINEDEVVESWQPVSSDFKAPEGTLYYRRLGWYNLDSATEVAQNLLRQLNNSPA